MEKPKEIDNEKALIKIYLIKRYFSIFFEIETAAPVTYAAAPPVQYAGAPVQYAAAPQPYY